jgi:HEAT repeat protein
MNADDPWYDPRPTEEIVSAMLSGPARDSDTYEDDSYWSNRSVVVHRVTPETLAIAVRLCESPCEIEQRAGCDILALLGAPDKPFRRESVGPVLSVLRRAADVETFHSAVCALGNIGDLSAVPEILPYASHLDPFIRESVAKAIPSMKASPLVVPALIALSRDAVVRVRDWAVFGLMNWIEDDTPEIRQALSDRLDDLDATVRGQALLGLARRRVPGTLDVIAREFERPEIHPDAVEAVADLGDPRGMELLQRLRARFPDWDVVPYEMDRLSNA